jgi:hypothetical protein
MESTVQGSEEGLSPPVILRDANINKLTLSHKEVHLVRADQRDQEILFQ